MTAASKGYLTYESLLVVFRSSQCGVRASCQILAKSKSQTEIGSSRSLFFVLFLEQIDELCLVLVISVVSDVDIFYLSANIQKSNRIMRRNFSTVLQREVV